VEVRCAADLRVLQAKAWAEQREFHYIDLAPAAAVVAAPVPWLQNASTDHALINLTANAAGKVAGVVDWGWGISAICIRNRICFGQVITSPFM
jgi:hypothetical protein